MNVFNEKRMSAMCVNIIQHNDVFFYINIQFDHVFFYVRTYILKNIHIKYPVEHP